jgi:hypothetical protein
MKLSGLPKRQFIILSVLAAVTDRRRISLVRDKLGLRGTFESLHMGFNILYWINHCHMQACVGASRVRYKLKKSCPDDVKLRVIRNVACEVKAGLRQRFHRPSLLKTLMPFNQLTYASAANLSLCKRADGRKNVTAA